MIFSIFNLTSSAFALVTLCRFYQTCYVFIFLSENRNHFVFFCLVHLFLFYSDGYSWQFWYSVEQEILRRGFPILLFVLKGRHLTFYIQYDIFIDTFYQVEKVSSYYQFSHSLYQEQILKIFKCVYLEAYVSFFFGFLAAN